MNFRGLMCKVGLSSEVVEIGKTADVFCVLVGHSYVHEVQTVAQIFFGFGGVKSRLADKATVRYLAVTGVSGAGDGRCTYGDGSVWARVYEGEVLPKNLISEQVFLVGEPSFVQAGLSEKRVLMLALFCALRRVVPIDVPWGQ